jgi:hypothetical protein
MLTSAASTPSADVPDMSPTTFIAPLLRHTTGRFFLFGSLR